MHRLISIALGAATCVCAQTVAIPGGSFSMGSNSGEEDERPLRTVTVGSFEIDKFEVSYAQYDSCVKSGECSPAHYEDGKCLMWTARGLARVRVPGKYRHPDNPVVCVSWHQAREYCRYKRKRLPTEAEWEYAASGGSALTYSWGSQPPSPSRCTSPDKRHPVPGGSCPAGANGLFDMTGNVWEWTGDRYEKDYYAFAENDNPKGPPVGRYRVIRGGGWYSTPRQLRVANRQWFVPEYGEVSIGMRCVK